jgi:hypothetical protein
VFACLLVATSAACDSRSYEMSARVNCVDVDSIKFLDTAVGQTAEVALLAHRVGKGPKAPLEVSIDGPAAADFSLYPESDCVDAKLQQFEGCMVRLAFTPTRLGARTATLRIGDSDFPLSAKAVEFQSSLRANLRGVASMTHLTLTETRTNVVLTNGGTDAMSIGTSLDLGDTIDGGSFGACPTQLQPGESCTLQLVIASRMPGCSSGSLTITGDTQPIEIPIAATGINTLTVKSNGPGKITTSPSGLDCGPDSTCTFVLDDATPELRADPIGGAHFNGWSKPSCGLELTCTTDVLVRSGTSPNLGPPLTQAAFAPEDWIPVDVTFAGTGAGRVSFQSYLSTYPPMTSVCTSSCRLWLDPSTALTTWALHATTTSQFGGWEGDCSNPGTQCELANLAASDRRPRSTTVTFVGDSSEVTTLLPDNKIDAGTVDPSGGFVVAFGSLVSRLSADGALEWLTSLPRTAFFDAVGMRSTSSAAYLLERASGEQFGSGRLSRLDLVTGAVEWIVTVSGELSSSTIATTPSGGIAYGDGTSVRAMTPDGSLAWSIELGCMPLAIAIDSAGSVAAACDWGNVLRFAADRTPQSPFTMPSPSAPSPGAPMSQSSSLVFDAAGRIGVHAIQNDQRTVMRFDDSGTVTLDAREKVGGSSSYGALNDDALAFALPNGDLFAVLPYFGKVSSSSPYLQGGTFERYDGQGKTWTVSKTPTQEGPRIMDAACNAAGRCAVFGQYLERGWIEVFEFP